MPNIRDLSIFEKFNFERQPVGLKFLLNKPENIDPLAISLPMCEMFKEAQESRLFYATKDNFACMGSVLLGMKDSEPIMESGMIGEKEKIFREARANRRIYQYLPKIAKDTVRYVVFSSVDKLTFDPDVLVITASPSQAEILLRAACYSTGKLLSSKITPVMVCAWLFIYPFINGELNYMMTGLGYGMRTKKLMPEGLMLISIPYDQLPMIIENLESMDWILQMYSLDEDEKKEYAGRIMNEIIEEYRNG